MLTETDLQQFTGTEHYYKYLGGLKLTDGVKYLADAAGAYWLLDIIWSYQTPKIRRESFQVWDLKLLPKAEGNPNAQPAVVTMKTDTDNPLMVKQDLCYTDFPLDSITLYLIGGVILLPSEY